MSWLRGLTTRHLSAADGVFAFAIALLGLPSVVGPHPAQVGVSAWHLGLLQVALSAPLIWRRRAPLGVLAAIATVVTVQWILPGGWLQGDVALPIALYGVAVARPRTELRVACGIVAAVSLLVAVRWKGSDWPAALVVFGAVHAGAVALGFAVRFRRDHLSMLLERAVRLRIERDQGMRLATAAERARIAREMHDIIAHNLSVMIGLADGARYAVAKSPDRAEEAMEKVSVTGRQALGELRQLLGLLRADGPEEDLGPQPGLDDLEELIERVRDAGLPVSVRTDGAMRDLPAGVQLAAYRIVQEALTNSIKYAGPGATATVLLRYAPDSIGIDVTDTGRGGDDSRAGLGGGIPGMAQRAAIYDGTIDAGPGAGGGWRVHTRLYPRSTESTESSEPAMLMSE